MGGKVLEEAAELLSWEAAPSSLENPCPMLLPPLPLVCLEISPLEVNPQEFLYPGFCLPFSSMKAHVYTAWCRPDWELHRWFAGCFLEEIWTVEQGRRWAQV